MTDQTVLVTGAASGIGRASVADMLEHGHRVVAMDIDAAALEAAHPGLNENLRLFAGDVSEAARCAAAVADAVEGFGGLDALVHWAAIHSTEMWDELTAEAFDNVLRVNVTGSFLMSQAAARHMVPKGKGAIVLTASTSVLSGGVGGNGRGGPAYTSSKGAIIVLTRALARSLGPHGIRVNAVSPGSTDTPMIAEYSGAAREGVAARAALGRIGDAAEIAAVARFLISDDASYLAGAVINANGGAAFS
jgi:NAD(P)-dependent dehydrogenase (short-subunit alcohol dehydrogenase family)